jgi:CRISPR/Cas system-associated exonuclease Cas4 (RecB family)
LKIDGSRDRADIKALGTNLAFSPINTVLLDDLVVVEVETSDLIGHVVTVQKPDFSEVSGKVISAKDERYQSYDQLMFYAIYFFIKYQNIMEIHISYLYVEHNLENSLVLERKYLNNYIKSLITDIKKIEETTEFNKNESKLCDFCGFNEICLYK